MPDQPTQADLTALIDLLGRQTTEALGWVARSSPLQKAPTGRVVEQLQRS
jgi:hypothetical protein